MYIDGHTRIKVEVLIIIIDSNFKKTLYLKYCYKVHSKLSRNQTNIKKHEKYYHSIKVCTLGGHNPLCLKSYKIRTPMKIFNKPIFKVKCRGFSGIRTHKPHIHDMSSVSGPNSFVQNRAVVEDCSRNLRFVGLNPTKTSSFHLENWFFENFHRGPYFVGFQTKWILTL